MLNGCIFQPFFFKCAQAVDRARKKAFIRFIFRVYLY